MAFRVKDIFIFLFSHRKMIETRNPYPLEPLNLHDSFMLNFLYQISNVQNHNEILYITDLWFQSIINHPLHNHRHGHQGHSGSQGKTGGSWQKPGIFRRTQRFKKVRRILRKTGGRGRGHY